MHTSDVIKLNKVSLCGRGLFFIPQPYIWDLFRLKLNLINRIPEILCIQKRF